MSCEDCKDTGIYTSGGGCTHSYCTCELGQKLAEERA